MIELLCWVIPVGGSLLIALGTGFAAVYFMISKSEKEDSKQRDTSSKYSLKDQKEIRD